jgi:son of sevenless-like protein
VFPLPAFRDTTSSSRGEYTRCMAQTYQVDGMYNDSMVADEESFISTFFVRALYDYQSNDPSSLSFRRDDIIEVLTRLDSGWWDGLLGEERGWFPSNYVTVISAQEAEATLGSLDSSTGYSSSEATDTEVDMAAAMGDSGNESDWAGSGIDMERVAINNTRQAATTGKSATDFWVPQISADGQVDFLF